MGKFDIYKIDLKGMLADTQKFEFLLDDTFFADIDNPDVKKGTVNVALEVKKTFHAFEFNFQTNGMVTIPCDRCLDDMDQPINSTDRLIVKFGEEYSEEDDNLVIIPEEEGVINVAWFMFEFIALAIPLKHVHALGQCNEEMMNKLNQILRTSPDEESVDDDTFSDDEDFIDDEREVSVDPRWNELKKILDNN